MLSIAAFVLFFWFELGDAFASSSLVWATAPSSATRYGSLLHSPFVLKKTVETRSRATTTTFLGAARNAQTQPEEAGQKMKCRKRSNRRSAKEVMHRDKNRPQVAKRFRSSSVKKSRMHGATRSPNANRKLNAELVQCSDAGTVLDLLASTKGALTATGGGGRLNSVNFSTSLHRIARHLQFSCVGNSRKNSDSKFGHGLGGNNRSKILADPRFALLVCSAGEALVQGEGQVCVILDASSRPVKFGSREMSNMAWALTKLKIVPPQSALSICLTPEGTVDRVAELTREVRSLVYQAARKRSHGNDRSHPVEQSETSTWIPTLSKLCGVLLDTISYKVLTEADSPTAHGEQDFQLQERANLMWALATSQRGHRDVAIHIVSSLICGMKQHDSSDAEVSSRFSRRSGGGVGVELARPQEWSNSIWAVATTGFVNGPEEILLPFVASLMSSNKKESFLDQFKPQELSNTAWGVATILSNRCKSKPSTIVDTNDLDGDSTSKYAATAHAALEILRHVARQVIDRQDKKGQHVRFKTQELSNTAWAFATVGFGLTRSIGSSSSLSSNTDYLILASDTPAEDRLLMKQAMRVIIEKLKCNIGYCRSQELNNIAWTMARLNLVDYELMSLIGTQMCDERRIVSSQDIGTTLWSFASSGFFDKDVYRCIAKRLRSGHSNQFKSQELSNTLWALATAEVTPYYLDVFDTTLLSKESRPSPFQIEDDPVTVCFAIAAHELMRRPFDFKSQEIKDILWSFSKVGMRHPALFKSIAEHLVGSVGGNDQGDIRGLAEFSPQGIGNLAWAFARQGQIGCEVMQRYEGATTICKSTGRLAVYTVGFSDFDELLLKRLFREMALVHLRVHDGLTKLQPQDLSNTIWAMAVYGLKHEDFLAVAAQQLARRAQEYLQGQCNLKTQFKGQEVANLAWGFATLNGSCSGLMTTIAPYVVAMCKDDRGRVTVASIARALKRQEMANLAWACAVFGDYPPELVKVLYMGIVGVGESADPDYVSEAHRDEAIQGSAVMSIIYLQIARDLEEKSSEASGLVLPPDFPAGWEILESKNGTGDNELELRLSTSKIQRDVSGAFRRIGFPHVEEHVINMESLSNEYGIQMASLPKDILSFDIANVDDKIGIEVDGPAHFLSLLEDEGDDGIPGSGPRTVSGKIEYQFSWSGDGQQINGATALKSRLMEGLGWRVINIPFWEWYSLKDDPNLEDQYCRKLLAEYLELH